MTRHTATDMNKKLFELSDNKNDIDGVLSTDAKSDDDEIFNASTRLVLGYEKASEK